MSESPSKSTPVGFIGTGVMGGSMAGHLLVAGYELHVHNRSRPKSESLIARGAVWHDTPGGLTEKCGIIVTMVGFPKDVEETYFGPRGIFPSVRPGTRLVDMTTSRPLLAKRIYEEAKRKGCFALDAPVSGGDKGAREAGLSIMVGGDRERFEELVPFFSAMGKTVVHQGGPGSGQHTKMANQIAIASGMIAICEALAYTKKAGLDPSTVLKSIGNGAAGSWSLNNLWPRIISEDYAPGFYVKHFIKDMGIALESAAEMGLELPGLSMVKSFYDRLAEKGGGDFGTQALFKMFEE
jgi:3-hydroxyisobutyrate dehydrogenase